MWQTVPTPPAASATIQRQATSILLAARRSNQENTLMYFLIWLIVGGVTGWLASILMQTNDQQGILLNVIVGIVGAVLGGWLISPMLAAATINQDTYSRPALFVSFTAAAILLAIVSVVRSPSWQRALTARVASRTRATPLPPRSRKDHEESH